MDLDTQVNSAVDTAVTSAASKTMGGGVTTSILGAVTSNEAIAVTGLIITISGFILNLIFQVRRDNRDRALHEARLARVQAELNKDTK